MLRPSPRGARISAPLALVVTGALAGCSNTNHPAAAQPTPPPVASSAAASPAGDRQLAAAQARLAAETSYRFNATETVHARTAVTTRLTGTIVRAEGISYTLTVGKTRTQIVRLRHATYVRTPPGPWTRRNHPAPSADPTRTLTTVLASLAGAQAHPAPGRTVITGTLPPSAATTAGIPTTNAGAHVAVTINTHNQVVLLTVRTATAAGAKLIPVTLTIHYTDIDRVPAIHRPH